MRCSLGYHWNELTLKVHTPGCSHPAESSCHPLPGSFSSLREAVNYAFYYVDFSVSPCYYCAEREELSLRRRR